MGFLGRLTVSTWFLRATLPGTAPVIDWNLGGRLSLQMVKHCARLIGH
jgi:hypothetical protein